MSVRLEDIDLETVDLSNIREQYDDEDLLGDSLLKGQQAPIIVGPLVSGKRKVFDGSRRVRAALKKGMRKLTGVVSERHLSPEELAQFQLISDIHKKHLTPYERSMAALGIEKSNPGLTIKQMAALINMDETLLGKYLQARRLSPESLRAYREGKIGLTAVVEVSKLPFDEQPILLEMKVGGATRNEIRASRKRRNATRPDVRTAKIRCPLPSGQVVTVAGDQLSLEEAVEALAEAGKAMKSALSKGLNAKTAMNVWRDVAAAG
jgi:ParB family transcriptional regulator, chromosome partitioning protein